MADLVFWFYISSLIVFSISGFTEIMVQLSAKETENRDFMLFLLGIFFILFGYTLYYFSHRYLDSSVLTLTKAYVLAMVLSSILLLAGLVGFIRKLERKPGRFFYFIPLAISVSVSFVLIAVLHIPMLSAFIVAFLLLIMAAVFLLWRNLRKSGQIINGKWKFLFISILAGIPIEILEYAILQIKVPKELLPNGLLSFSTFAFLCGTLIIIYNIRLISVKSPEDFWKTYAISSRECDVVKLLAQGKTRQEIADSLFISIRTVDRHLENVYKKCSVKNAIELINLLK